MSPDLQGRWGGPGGLLGLAWGLSLWNLPPAGPLVRCSHSSGVWRAWRGPGRECQAACRPPALESCPECLQEGEGSSGPESHSEKPRTHTWPLTSDQGTPGDPDKPTESQAEFSHPGCGHVAHCDTPPPMTPPRGCLAVGARQAAFRSVRGHRPESGMGQVQPETTQSSHRHPQGARRGGGGGGQPVGRPLGRKEETRSGYDWEAVGCG